MKIIKNVPFDELTVGQSAEINRKITDRDIKIFARLSGDINPVHVDDEYAKTTPFNQRIAHGMWGGALISAVLGTKLPGPGAIYLNQSLSFRKPIKIGDTIRTEVTTVKKDAENKRAIFNCKCVNQNKEIVVNGEAELIVPTEKLIKEVGHLPEILMYDEGKKLRQIISNAVKMPGKLPVAVIHPTSAQAVEGAVLAAKNNLIDPIFIGPITKMQEAADNSKADLSVYQCIDSKDDITSSMEAIKLVANGSVTALMKGEMHTDVLMHIVVSKESGLRTDRRISHCLAMDVPEYHKLMFIADAAVNILPNVETKRDIIQNTVDFLHTLGIKKPKVALLSAVETVLDSMPATKDAQELCKMTNNGKITGAILSGPLAFDIAISKKAALAKHVESEVAGDSDVFIVPNIEAGNIMIKQLEYLSYGRYAGLILGAKVPIILTSRVVAPIERLASCALAKIYMRKFHILGY